MYFVISAAYHVPPWPKKSHHKRFQESPKISQQGMLCRISHHIISMQDEHISFASPGIFYQGLKVSGGRVPKGVYLRSKVVYLVIRSGQMRVSPWPGIQLRCVASHCALHSRQKPFIRELTLSLGGQTPPDQSICLALDPCTFPSRTPG